jgi:hypothetical protein
VRCSQVVVLLFCEVPSTCLHLSVPPSSMNSLPYSEYDIVQSSAVLLTRMPFEQIPTLHLIDFVMFVRKGYNYMNPVLSRNSLKLTYLLLQLFVISNQLTAKT